MHFIFDVLRKQRGTESLMALLITLKRLIWRMTHAHDLFIPPLHQG